MDDRDRHLEDTVDDLAETLESLREELREPPRGPLGLPRPPTPREFLRFTEQYSIPALISLLEASIRTLELLAAAIRVADGRPLDGDSTLRREATAAGTDRVAAASRRTLAALDDALAELQSAAAGGEPDSPELQRLLSDARDLRAEVDQRLADAARTGETGSSTPDGPDPVNIEVEGGDDESSEDVADAASDGPERDVGVDVDRELESIKRELDDPADDISDERPDLDNEAADPDGPGDGSGDEASVDGQDADESGGPQDDETPNRG